MRSQAGFYLPPVTPGPDPGIHKSTRHSGLRSLIYSSRLRGGRIPHSHSSLLSSQNIKKKAFTLAEILIVVALIAIFSFSLYSLYKASIGSFNVSANKSESLQASYFMYQKLMYEFKMAIVNESYPISIESTEGGQNNKLSFFIFTRDPNVPARILTQQIEYEFIPENYEVRRNGKVLKPDKFSQVEFLMEGPDPATPAPGVHKLLFRVTGIGRQTYLSLKAGTRDERIARDQVTLTGGFSIPYKTVGEAFPSWQLNSTSFPQ